MSNIVEKDNLTTLEFIISDDSIVNLSSAKTITFRMKKNGSYIEKIANVTDAVNGKCQVILSNTDTDTSGRFQYQITIEFIDGSVFSSETKMLTIVGKL